MRVDKHILQEGLSLCCDSQDSSSILKPLTQDSMLPQVRPLSLAEKGPGNRSPQDLPELISIEVHQVPEILSLQVHIDHLEYPYVKYP